MMVTDIDTYFAKGCGRCARFDTPECSVKLWLAGMTELRRICREAGLTETVKWGQPCYTHAGRNIAILGAFRGNFRIIFFHAGLLSDPEGILVKPGPNSTTPEMVCFTEASKVTALEPTLRAYLAEAMAHAEAGRTDDTPRPMPDWPQELTDALDADPELADAFHALTQGRQKSYVINLNSAKKSETRVARIAKFRNRILSGKGAMER